MFALPPASAVVPGDDCVVAALPEIAGNPEGPEPLGVAGADDLRCLLQIVVLTPRDITALKPLRPGGNQRFPGIHRRRNLPLRFPGVIGRGRFSRESVSGGQTWHSWSRQRKPPCQWRRDNGPLGRRDRVPLT